jgi:hypothetical protein
MIGALVAGQVGSGGASLSSYESIATANITGSSKVITISSIPTTFKHLQLRIAMLATSGDCGITVNGDTAANYARHVLRGDGSTVSSFGVASTNVTANLFPGGISNTYPSVAIIDILDYGSTSKYKTFRIFSGQDFNGSGYLEPCSGLWMNTAAINSITVTTAGAANWSATSRVALYGIKEA